MRVLAEAREGCVPLSRYRKERVKVRVNDRCPLTAGNGGKVRRPVDERTHEKKVRNDTDLRSQVVEVVPHAISPKG